MNKKFLLIALFCLLPLVSATIVDQPDSISCQINEVALSADGTSATPIREDIVSIETGKYWNVWCYVQDSQMQGVNGANVDFRVDGTIVSASHTFVGWVNFPVLMSPETLPAFYSTEAPGPGSHTLTFSTATKQYNQVFSVGSGIGTDFTIYWIGIGIVGIIIAILVFLYFTGKKRR